MSQLEIDYCGYHEIEYAHDTPIVITVFQGQHDPSIAKNFPEVEAFRSQIDEARNQNIHPTLQHITKGEILVPILIVYVKYPWVRAARLKAIYEMTDIGFYQEVSERIMSAMHYLRELGYQKLHLLMSGKVRGSFLRSKKSKEQLTQLLRISVESIMQENGSYEDLKETPLPTIEHVTYVHFGKFSTALGNVIRHALVIGSNVGTGVAFARYLTEIPPNRKPPLQLLQHIIGRDTYVPSSKSSAGWQKIPDHRFGSETTVSCIYGLDSVRNFGKHGFGLIAAVAQGSSHEPCVLKLHYRPQGSDRSEKRVVLIGKGVTFDTGGINAKYDEALINMHMDMAGVATAVAIIRIAEEFNLAVEIIAILPMVENNWNKDATRPHDIVRAFNGKTVEILNTDCEGRLLLADCVAYSEKYLNPDFTICIATLSDMSMYAPNILRAFIGNEKVRAWAEKSERLSAENVIVMPTFDRFRAVDNSLEGERSDLVNYAGSYLTDGFMFVFNFFQTIFPVAAFVDVAALMENDATNWGAGPGFGTRFVWHLVQQHAK